jgi:hypothetical protein
MTIVHERHYKMRKLLALIAAATLTACASDPAPKNAAPVAASAPAPAAASAPASASATSPVAAKPATATGEFVPPAGYKVKKRGETTVYCKVDTPVGTRFGTEYCYTRSDLERIEASRVNTRQEVERARRTCTGGGCGGG